MQMQILVLFKSAMDRFPLIIYGVAWTSLLTLTVALASLSPEISFVIAISPSSSCSKPCLALNGDAIMFRIPIDMPGEKVCLPAHLFTKSPIDLIVPPVFAALVVAAAAFVVRAVGLWENDDALDEL